MTGRSIELSFLSFAVLISLTKWGCRKSEMVWGKDLPVIGSQSSLRTADLNGDGVLDIVMGAGAHPFAISVELPIFRPIIFLLASNDFLTISAVRMGGIFQV